MKRWTVMMLTILFVAFATGAICDPQPPRLRKADGTLKRPSDREIRALVMSGTVTTLRTVCYRQCDFITISEALAYVATQERSLYRHWTVRVMGGDVPLGSANSIYSEVTLSVPSWTTIEGVPSTSTPGGSALYDTPAPLVNLTGTTGTLLTFGEGSGCHGVKFSAEATLTGNTVMAKSTGNEPVIIESCAFWGFSETGAFTYDIFMADASQTYLLNSTTWRGGGASSTVRNFVNNSGTTNIILGRHVPNPGQGQVKLIEVLGGSLSLNWTRLVTGATTALTVTGGTATNRFSAIPNYSGTVTTDLLYAPNGGSLPATCSVGQTFVNTTGAAEKWCSCTATNIWRCASLTAP